MPEKRYYITTPIYYVNGVPHVGSATTTLLCDAHTRYRKLRGDNAYFLTGTDEHAQKVADAAVKVGKIPQAFVDEVSQRFVECWQYLGIEYDSFIRTSEERHKKVVREVFSRLQASGDVYLGVYEGWYSVADETFFRDTDVDENGIVKETGAKVERIQEEVHYFKLSAYGERLKAHIDAHPTFLLPETRRNEVLAMIEDGLRDIAISRKNAGWGIAVPGDPEKVFYVWFDALINYLSDTGWPESPDWNTRWPADAHLMAKEIYARFHATFWPAMLLGLGLPLPKHVVGHGWWTVGGEKGSKSKGNIPEPKAVVEALVAASGASESAAKDALRYYLLRDIRFTDDSEFSLELLANRWNADLGNDFGNVLNRILKATYFDGVVPVNAPLDAGLAALAAETVAGYTKALERFDWGSALASVWPLLRAVNVYLAQKAPWKAAKAGETEAVAEAVYNALEGVRLATYLLSPVMPGVAAEVAQQLGVASLTDGTWEESTRFGTLPGGIRTGEPAPLFPRVDTKILTLTETPMETTPAPSVATETPAETSNEITIDDFLKVELRIADIVAAEKVEGADKLLKLQLKIGEEDRQIVSGIATAYTPEELVGRQIVVVYNLKPRKMRGVESKGMLLAATDAEGNAILLQPDKKADSGSTVR
ncbi:methionine--tRNA ligase [Armatimonas sp.]|uniref:methionine--tRNA ligase n=1 Tax=Armatimonas sp. TaxID=1872638 RepID=UPI003751ECBF